MLQLSSNRKSRDICRPTQNIDNNFNKTQSPAKMCPKCAVVSGETSELQDGLPKYSSAVTMVQKIGGKDRKIRVVLKIYGNMYGSYGVVSQDRVIVKDCGYINLKSCTVFKNEADLSVQIVQRNCEGLSLTFHVPNAAELTRLMNILQPEVIGTDGLVSSDSSLSIVSNNKENQNPSGCQESKLDRLWKRDLSPRATICDKRKGSLPALDESEENEDSESESDCEEQDT